MNSIWILLLLCCSGCGNQRGQRCGSNCIQPRQQNHCEHHHCHNEVNECKLNPPAWQDFSSGCNCD